MDLLFFTPHAALWPHTAPEAYLARALAACGHQVRYLTCGKMQTYCAPMTARRHAPGCRPEEVARICSDCKAAADAIAMVYGFPVDALANYLTPDDFDKLNSIASDAVRCRSLDTIHLGVNVGRLALYEFTLAHKKMSTELTSPQWLEYEIYLDNALRTLEAFSRQLKDNRPDAIFTFSPQYSNINSCMQYAILQKVRVMFLESGTNLSDRLSSMRIWDWQTHKLVNPALTYWGHSGSNPVTQIAVDAVLGHFQQLLSGHHFAVFSAPYTQSGDLRKRWNISKNQKVLLMTLSSYDEAYAALLISAFPPKKVFSSVFRTQAEWIRATIDWAKDRQDVYLVIRVHPRDFPNKRENFRSEQSFMLEGLLEEVPTNVHVNWPSEGVSLYELLEDTDVLLTGWSVTALEALTLGIPIVTYDANLPSYPSDIHYTGRSASEYFGNIDRALADGWSIRNAINGFRWLAYNFVTCTVKVSDHFGKFELNQQISWGRRLLTRVMGRLPRLSHSLDLLRWRSALPGGRIVSNMLQCGLDALPPARISLAERPASSSDDRMLVLKGLEQLHVMLYRESKLPADKPGLSKHIRALLVEFDSQ